MYKLKVSKREIAANFYIVGAGYCQAAYLLWYEEPFGYSSGQTGWSCDYYQIKDGENIDVIISTGYSPLKSKNTNPEKLKEYEEKARAIVNGDTGFEASKAAVTELLLAFVREAKQSWTHTAK